MAFAALMVDLTAKLAGYQQSMNQAVKVAQDSAKKIESAFSFPSAAKAGAAFFGAQLGLESLREALVTMKNLQDEWTRVNVLVNNVTKGINDAAYAQQELYKIAQQTRASYSDTAQIYSALSRNAEELGITTQQVLGLQRTVSQAVALSGARADSAASALVQFGQGLASGVLRGEELNSVLEQTPRLAKAIAEGMGVTTGELLKMGKQGELTAERIIAALEKVAPVLAEEMKKVEPTFDDIIKKMMNSVGNLLNRINEIVPVWTTIKNIMSGAADALDRIVQLSRFDPASTQKMVREGLEAQLKARQQRVKDYEFAASGQFDMIGDEKERERLRNQLNAGRVGQQNFYRDFEVARRSIDSLTKSIVEMDDAQRAAGFGPNGAPTVPMAKLEQSRMDAFVKASRENTERYAEMLNEIAGIDKGVGAKLRLLMDRRETAKVQETLPEFQPGGPRADDRVIYSQKQYEEDVTRVLKTSGLIKKEKEKKDTFDPLAVLIKEQEAKWEGIEKLREKILEAIDPLRELQKRLQDIYQLGDLGVELGGLSTEEVQRAVADIYAQMSEARKKFEDSPAFVGPPSSMYEDFQKVRAELDKYIDSLLIEGETLSMTAVQREALTKMLDYEAKGLQRGSQAWEDYRLRIEEALKMKRLGELDAAKGGVADSRTDDIALLTERLQNQINAAAEGNGAGVDDIKRFQDQYLAAVEAIIGANKELRDNTIVLGQAFTTFFEQALLEGADWSDAWKGLLKDVAQQVIRVQISLPMAKAVNSAMSGVSGGKTLFDLFTGLFGRAEGGQVGAGQSYLIGERGIPEVFTPNQSGRITPLKDLRGGGVVVNNYVSVTGEVSRSDIYNAVAASEARTKASILDSMDRRGVFARK